MWKTAATFSEDWFVYGSIYHQAEFWIFYQLIMVLGINCMKWCESEKSDEIWDKAAGLATCLPQWWFSTTVPVSHWITVTLSLTSVVLFFVLNNIWKVHNNASEDVFHGGIWSFIHNLPLSLGICFPILIHQHIMILFSFCSPCSDTRAEQFSF